MTTEELTVSPTMRLKLAGAYLRAARDQLKFAKAERPAKRVNSAIKSVNRLASRKVARHV